MHMKDTFQLRDESNNLLKGISRDWDKASWVGSRVGWIMAILLMDDDALPDEFNFLDESLAVKSITFKAYAPDPPRSFSLDE